MPHESRPSQALIDFFHEQLALRVREWSDLDPVSLPPEVPEASVCMIALPVDGLFAGRVPEDAPSWWRFLAVRGSFCALAEIGREANGEPEWRGLLFDAELCRGMVALYRRIAAHRPATDVARIVTVSALGISALWFAGSPDSNGALPTDRFIPIRGMSEFPDDAFVAADAFWSVLRDRANGPDAQGGGLAPLAAEPISATD